VPLIEDEDENEYVDEYDHEYAHAHAHAHVDAHVHAFGAPGFASNQPGSPPHGLLGSVLSRRSP
jgi:hypothetical protein